MKKRLSVIIPLIVTSVIILGLIMHNQSTNNSRYVDEIYLLEIFNLKENYYIDDMITLTIHEKGFNIRCFSVYAEIYDSFGNKIWEEPQVEECPLGLGKSSFDHNIPFSTINIDEPGKYQLFVHSRGTEISQSFSVLVD